MRRYRVVTSRTTRRWLNAIPITGRFHIMLAILLLAEAGIVIGCLHVAHQQSESSTELARVAAVQRSLDPSVVVQGSLASELQDGHFSSAADAATLVTELRTQIDATFALPASPEVASIIDNVRVPATHYI